MSSSKNRTPEATAPLFPDDDLPGLTQCASSFVFPRGEHLPFQTLPAAGALTNQAFVALPLCTKRVSFWCRYEQESETNNPQYQLEFQTSEGEIHRVTFPDVSSIVVGGGDISIDDDLLSIDGPEQTGSYLLAHPQTGEWYFAVPPGAAGVRLRAREEGDTADPGSLEILISFDG